MAARITRSPDMVCKLGMRLLDYLNETIHYRLGFCGEPAEHHIDVYTDSSFAPNAGRSQGASVIFYQNCPITWRSGKQPLVTLSTAESELLEAIEGVVLGNSTKGLVEELLQETV